MGTLSRTDPHALRAVDRERLLQGLHAARGALVRRRQKAARGLLQGVAELRGAGRRAGGDVDPLDRRPSLHRDHGPAHAFEPARLAHRTEGSREVQKQRGPRIRQDAVRKVAGQLLRLPGLHREVHGQLGRGAHRLHGQPDHRHGDGRADFVPVGSRQGDARRVDRNFEILLHPGQQHLHQRRAGQDRRVADRGRTHQKGRARPDLTPAGHDPHAHDPRPGGTRRWLRHVSPCGRTQGPDYLANGFDSHHGRHGHRAFRTPRVRRNRRAAPLAGQRREPSRGRRLLPAQLRMHDARI